MCESNLKYTFTLIHVAYCWSRKCQQKSSTQSTQYNSGESHDVQSFKTQHTFQQKKKKKPSGWTKGKKLTIFTPLETNWGLPLFFVNICKVFPFATKCFFWFPIDVRWQKSHLQCVWQKLRYLRAVMNAKCPRLLLSLLREKSVAICFHLLQALHQVVVGHLHFLNFFQCTTQLQNELKIQ